DVAGTEAVIQLNDKIASISDIQQFIYAERQARREELVPFLTTALKVDKETNMGLVSDIKQELRKADALKINYTTRTGDPFQNME
ncbi:MAG TPA: biopolymer transporter ExbD, partial [Salinimicrobium sp.]|nr:biopolymer transporter ExbD [Salinimicrobium sp.]